MANAKRLAAAGAEAVKAEGGREILEQVRAIVASGIPFLGHLGMLPQHVLEEGGYHVKGKNEPEHQALLADAQALAAAGAFAVVLELVTPRVAKELTQQVPIPTIGIGAGPDCDGQILVTPDLLGMLPWFDLKHVKPKLNAAEQMRKVVKEWKQGVEAAKAIAGQDVTMKKLTHIDTHGEASMVDVSAKPVMLREAVASGEVRLQRSHAEAHRVPDHRQRQRPGRGAIGGHPGGQEDRRTHSPLPSPAPHALRGQL